MLAQAAQQNKESVSFFGVISGPDERVDDDKVRAVAKRTRMPYPQIRDRDLDLTHRFHVRGTPTIIVIAPDKTIAHHGSRPPKTWR